MAKLDELKNVKVNELTETQLTSHKEEVLTLNETEIVDYLYHLIDNEYELSDEDNTTQVAKFLREPDFKNHFEKIITENEEMETTETSETSETAE